MTGAIPVVDDDLVLQDVLRNYFSPQVKPNKNLRSNSNPSDLLGSVALVDGSSCNEHAEHPTSTEERASSSRVELDGGNDGLLGTGTLNRYGYMRKVKKFIKQDAKDLLEPLGRKLCKQALAFVKESRHASLFFEKQAKAMPVSFYLSQNFRIDC